MISKLLTLSMTLQNYQSKLRISQSITYSYCRSGIKIATSPKIFQQSFDEPVLASKVTVLSDKKYQCHKLTIKRRGK